jgi:hypothetical protein
MVAVVWEVWKETADPVREARSSTKTDGRADATANPRKKTPLYPGCSANIGSRIGEPAGRSSVMATTGTVAEAVELYEYKP